METTPGITGGTPVAQRFVCGDEVSDRSQPGLGADLRLHAQVDRAVATKEARDRWEAEQAARVCGCPHCRSAYQATLDFYATLGTGQPAHERISANHLVGSAIHLSGSPLERR
jgi:hypothetical protein